MGLFRLLLMNGICFLMLPSIGRFDGVQGGYNTLKAGVSSGAGFWVEVIGTCGICPMRSSMYTYN